MDKEKRKILEDIKEDLMSEEKELMKKILNRAIERKKISTEEYLETGHEIYVSLAEVNVISVLDKYIENNELGKASQFLYYIFQDYGFDVCDEGEIKEEVEFLKSVLPIVVQIQVRKITMEVYIRGIENDIRNLRKTLDLRRQMFEIQKRLDADQE